MNIKLQLIAPHKGVSWIRKGFAVFFIRPTSFALLFGILMMGVMVLQLLAWLGSLLLLAALPLLTLWFALLTRHVLDQQPMAVPKTLLAPFKAHSSSDTSLTVLRRRRALALLGLTQVLTALLIWMFSDWLGGGALQKLLEQAAQNAETAQAMTPDQIPPQAQLSLFVGLGLTALACIPFWHAPMLVFWGGYSAAKALFASTVAIWKNRGAFVLFVLAWLGLVITVLASLQLVSMLVGSAALTALLLPTAWLVLCTVFYASVYFTFAECFTEV